MGTAEDDMAVEYVVNLPTTEQRRTVASISRSELLTSVRALAGCQRCGFVEQVLAAFDPGLSSAGQAVPPSRTNTAVWLSTTSASTAATSWNYYRPKQSTYQRPGTLAERHLSPFAPASPNPETVPAAETVHPAIGGFATATYAGIMAPAKILTLLSSSGGSSDLVGLLQFAWKEAADGGAGASNIPSGGSAGEGRLALNDSLLRRPRLLRRFLTESTGVMQALSDEVGDCSRHSGCPGPAELASTLARLETQRCHALERLAAWGVLRVPPAQVNLVQPPTDRNLEEAAAPALGGLGGIHADKNMEADANDSELALAIQLSLRESEALAAVSPTRPQPQPMMVSSPLAGGSSQGNGMGSQMHRHQHRCNSPQQLQKQPLTSTPRRVQRTPPRPTTVAAATETVAGRTPGLVGLGPAGGGRHDTGAHPVWSLASPLEVGNLTETACPTRPPASEVQPLVLPFQLPPPASPLPVTAALAAAEGLADATVLVDSAAVEALSEGVRERVQHLVVQLVQVQQRRGRLVHACQHSILAAGRKLLLVLLQMLWVALRRSAAVAVAESVDGQSSPAEAAEAAADRGSGGTGHRVHAESYLAVGSMSAARRDATAQLSSPLNRLHSPDPQPPQCRLLPRYRGLLADLAAGLAEDDTHLVMDLDLDPDLDLDLGAELSAFESQTTVYDAAGGRNTDDNITLPLDQAGQLVAGGDGNSDIGDWDAAFGGGGSEVAGAHTAYVCRSRTSALQSPSALLSPTAATERHESLVGKPAAPSIRLATMRLDGARFGSIATDIGLSVGCGGPGNDFVGSNLDFQRTSCQTEVVAARKQQAEQLRVLQDQLLRCQSSQAELQGEVGRLLDMLAEQRRVQGQAVASLRRDLAQWQGEAGALQEMGTEELAELAAKIEAALSRVRAAQLQAAAERDLLCPVCWEHRKGLVFGCGHQTCCSCGEKLTACPICREPVSLRIRVYS